MRSRFDLAQLRTRVLRRVGEQTFRSGVGSRQELSEIVAGAGYVCADQFALEFGERLVDRRRLIVLVRHDVIPFGNSVYGCCDIPMQSARQCLATCKSRRAVALEATSASERHDGVGSHHGMPDALNEGMIAHHSSSNSRNGKPWLIVVASSAGGVKALSTLLASLPHDLPAAVVLVQHRRPIGPSYLQEILMRQAHMPVVTATSGDRISRGVVYIARPDRHLMVRPDRHFEYTDGKRIKFVLSSANPLLETAARVFDRRLIAVVLTGGGSDATDGVQTVKAHGGVVIAQDRASSEHWHMPESAVKTGAVDFVLPIEAIGPAITAIVHGHSVAEVASAT